MTKKPKKPSQFLNSLFFIHEDSSKCSKTRLRYFSLSFIFYLCNLLELEETFIWSSDRDWMIHFLSQNPKNFFRVFSPVRTRDFHQSSSDDQCSQLSRTLLNFPADLNSAVVKLVFILFQISSSSCRLFSFFLDCSKGFE